LHDGVLFQPGKMENSPRSETRHRSSMLLFLDKCFFFMPMLSSRRWLIWLKAHSPAGTSDGFPTNRKPPSHILPELFEQTRDTDIWRRSLAGCPIVSYSPEPIHLSLKKF